MRMQSHGHLNAVTWDLQQREQGKHILERDSTRASTNPESSTHTTDQIYGYTSLHSTDETHRRQQQCTEALLCTQELGQHR